MENQTNNAECVLPSPAAQQVLEARKADNTARVVAPSSYPSVSYILSKSDFVSMYRQYADVYELPPETHVWIALILLAAVLNSSVTISHGDLNLTLDLWFLLLSPSGSGRDTAIGPARALLKSAGLDILREEAFGSPEAAQEQISKRPRGMYLWPEFSHIMKQLNLGRFSGLKEWLTARYDSLETPESIKYRTHSNKKDSDTPPILFNLAPRLNILATCARDYFTNSMQDEDTNVGFIPRWTIVNLPESGRSIPKPQKRNPKPERFLVEFLQEASKLSGVACLSPAAEKLYNEWYHPTKARMKGSIEEPFFNRLRVQVLKLAVLAEVSKSLSLTVSPEAMKKALRLTESQERNLNGLFERGLTKTGGEIGRIVDFIKEAGVEGRSRSEVAKKFQYLNDRNKHLATLIEGETVVRFWRETKGRPAERFVHQNFVEEHKRKFPEDKEGA